MRDRLVRAYLWLLVITLPMDWFGPTGVLLREAGAKPAIPLLVVGAIALFGARFNSIVTALPVSSWRLGCQFLGIFTCGVLAFALNLTFGWSSFGRAKDPITQFIGQAAMFVLTPVLIVIHGELFREKRWSEYVMQVLPWAAGIHLFALALNETGLLRYNHLPLSMFRTGSEAVSMRVSGLFSEPSYFATMTAIYGVPLLFASRSQVNKRNTALALLMFAAALYSGGKTFIPVVICGFLGYAWYSKTPLFTIRNIVVALVLGSITVGVVISRSALNVQDNLSSAMRFGSTLTSVNAALAGYGLTGVGFGQFHFMFVKRFMPSFLLFSEEALTQMASSAEHRSSTYNLLTRYLIETGIIGLSLFLACLSDLYKLAKNDRESASLFGILLISTSMGFLMTQEPYCYPPLILGAALVLGGHTQFVSYASREVGR